MNHSVLLFLPRRREHSHLSASDAQERPLPLISGRLGFLTAFRCSIHYINRVFSPPLRDYLKAAISAANMVRAENERYRIKSERLTEK